MNAVADLHVSHIYLDELRQILGQAGDFHVGEAVGEIATHLRAGRGIFVDEVQRCVHA